MSQNDSVDVNKPEYCRVRVSNCRGAYTCRGDVLNRSVSNDNSNIHRDNCQSANNRNVEAEKTTYCRPVITLYSQDYLCNALEKHAKIESIVKRLVLTRKSEKCKEAWNNYINELKNKHKDYMQEPEYLQNICLSAEDHYPEVIENYYDKSGTNATPYKKLLQDLYGPYGTMQEDVDYLGTYGSTKKLLSSVCKPQFVVNSSYSYAVSPGRSRLLNRGNRSLSFSRNYPLNNRASSADRTLREEEKRSKGYNFKRRQSCNYPYSFFDPINDVLVKSSITQTNEKAIDSVQDKGTACDELSKNVNSKSNSQILKTQLSICAIKSGKSLQKIEDKIDSLIDSINSFITEIKTKKTLQVKDKSTLVRYKHSKKTFKSEIAMCGSETLEISKSKSSFEDEKSGRVSSPVDTDVTRFHNIIFHDIDKSEQVTRDIDLFGSQEKNPYAVQITFSIPKTEHSTEVTNSFLRVKDVVKDKNENLRIQSKIAIAVNTDPLGLLALFRVSSDALKQILSSVPNLDSAIGRFPGVTTSSEELHYMCHICGAAFLKPSQLSDHIEGHGPSKHRECRVCRHEGRASSCQHCGRRFARAYCCDLHEQVCARLHGRRHDVSSSLMLLQ